MSKTPYNGHESKTAWNVSLWLNNDESLYEAMLSCLRAANRPKSSTTQTRYRAARALHAELPPRTPDGCRYSVHTIHLAMRDIEL